MPKPEIERRVRNAAQVLGLEPFLKRKPRALSGGQRQRVAMGRAIVREPAAFLMDEPLSNLDAKLRVQMRAEVSRLQRNLGTTTIYVTHDQVEAMTMGDRVAVMRRGELQQVADPQTLYDRPVNLFVGGFIGSPSMNMIEATVARANGGLAVDVGQQKLKLDEAVLERSPALRGYEGRSHHPRHPARRPRGSLARARHAGRPPPARRRRAARGARFRADGALHGGGARKASTDDVRELAEDAGSPGGGPALESQGSGALLVGRFGARASVEEGKPVEVAVDTRSLHFFDAETSEGIYDGETSQKGASA